MLQNNEVTEVKNINSWEEALEKESWVAPLIDIYETQEDFILTAQMPGVSKDNVKIKLEEGHLTIMGRISFDEMINRKFILKESETGNFFRRFKISESIDDSKIDAKLENGVLTVSLPKHERMKPKTIDIK